MMELDAFMSRVEFEPISGCWLWSGAPGAGGYGVVRIRKRYMKAHRASWLLHNGELPPHPMKLCHKCDTPACVNPEHLFIGTQAENVADMIAKGRDRRTPSKGSKNGAAKLDEEKVWAIRQMLRLKMYSEREIARSYGISYMAMNRIARWESWKHVHLNWPFNPLPIYKLEGHPRDLFA